MNYIVSIDQSTSATKAVLFDEQCHLVARVNKAHHQYYPQPGWVEHDADEIYENTLSVIRDVVEKVPGGASAVNKFSLSITNQRETVVIWNKLTGRPIAHAVVWQDVRGAQICQELKAQGKESVFSQKSGLLLDPYFSGSGAKWLLDNTEGARAAAERGELLMGTTDCWLIWKLTEGRVHATDYTNASRTLLFNIHTLAWDDELLSLLDIPRSMMPDVKPCDSIFGTTTVGGLFADPIIIAGDLGDSHGALAGQMCFTPGMGKATYGTGSSVMVNIGEECVSAPAGLVTSVGFAACGKVYYAFEGNIHCQGATLQWMKNELRLIESVAEVEPEALSVPDNGGVYLVPAFVGLGAPWWNNECRAMICGMSLATTKGHICRAALEAIAYQVKDLIDLMTQQAGVKLQELRVDGGPTKNQTLMQFQADMLDATINRSDVEEASAMGAMLMNGLARGLWPDLDTVAALRTTDNRIGPHMAADERQRLHSGWLHAVHTVLAH